MPKNTNCAKIPHNLLKTSLLELNKSIGERGLASDGKYFIDPSSRVEIMYMILGESLGSSSPSTIQIMLVGYSNANVKVIERISKCLQEARNTYQNLQ